MNSGGFPLEGWLAGWLALLPRGETVAADAGLQDNTKNKERHGRGKEVGPGI